MVFLSTKIGHLTDMSKKRDKKKALAPLILCRVAPAQTVHGCGGGGVTDPHPGCHRHPALHRCSLRYAQCASHWL